MLNTINHTELHQVVLLIKLSVEQILQYTFSTILSPILKFSSSWILKFEGKFWGYAKMYSNNSVP